MTDAGFIDAEQYLRPEDYVFTRTFPTRLETEGYHCDQRRLDYIFIRENDKISLEDVKIIDNDTTQYLSDHLPVMAEVVLNRY